MPKPAPDCPRCKLSMNGTTYEDALVLNCAQCWGFWVPGESLRAILTSTDEEFSKAERKQVTDRKVQDPETDKVVPCVACGKAMQKRVVLGSLLLDFCPGHGVWLDTGEIKSIQVLAEIDDKVRDWLLNQVGC